MRTNLLTVALVLAAGSTARASDLFGTEYASSTPLYTVNQGSGAIASIGPSGIDNVGDLTSNPAAGQVWGVRITSNELISFNTSTGAGTALTTITGARGITSLAYNPVSGRLYGNESVSFSSVNTDILYEINPATGVATLVGPIGFGNVFALAFGNNGLLYGVSDTSDELISISTVSGAGSLIGATGRTGIFDIAARPEDGVVFAADSGTSSLYTIDLGTGATTLVGLYGSSTNIAGLAFVPTPGAASVLGLGVIALAGSRRRR